MQTCFLCQRPPADRQLFWKRVGSKMKPETLSLCKRELPVTFTDGCKCALIIYGVTVTITGTVIILSWLTY